MDPSRASRQLWLGVGEAWTAVTYLLSGILFWGAVGYGLDHVLGTRPVLLAVGVMLGNFASIYLVYVRWGRPVERTDAP